ncbi:MAG TPA: lipid-A-disaccharide synthase [Vicinamibacterales bacterium]|nr:lipid-A-disaccharide synthase [Vicinamibacterales bacterium]
MNKIMISCGEPSGDLYAGALAVEIRRREPDAAIFGLGGQRLMAGGGELLADYRGLSVTGLVEALRVIPKSFSVLNRLIESARVEKPNALVAIDFPDFNFRLAAAVKKLGIPVIYYISPQLWAWRKSRMRVIKRIADRVLVIFPFEEQIYRDAGVPVQFVGHPLVDLARAQEPRDAFLREIGLDGSRPIVALLPGSRPNEVERLLPVMRDAVKHVVARRQGVQFVIARAPSLDDRLFADVKWDPVKPAIVLARTDDVLAIANVVITASGTATVQAALHGCPMVVIYRLSPLSYRLGRRFVHVDDVAMVNLIAGRRIVPELIQDECTAESIADEALSLLRDAKRAELMRAGLAEVRGKLGSPGASSRAAEAVLDVARSKRAP